MLISDMSRYIGISIVYWACAVYIELKQQINNLSYRRFFALRTKNLRYAEAKSVYCERPRTFCESKEKIEVQSQLTQRPGAMAQGRPAGGLGRAIGYLRNQRRSAIFAYGALAVATLAQ